jgi:NADPH-dependent ferric siderophore reductase
VSTRPGTHDAVVLRREQLSTSLVRLVLDAPTFTSTGVPDEWVALVVPGQFQSRYYTVRNLSGSELVLDVVVHDEGLVTGWARGDVTGQTVTISDPKGSFAEPEDAGWVVLVGDLTALPAIARIRESVGLPVQAWVESPDGPIVGYVDGVTWLDPPAPGESGLAALVTGLSWPAGPGYFWMAGESAQMRDIRRFVRRELGWDSRHHDLMGYWSNTRGRRARAVDPGPIYARGKAAGRSDEEIWAEYDEARRG